MSNLWIAYLSHMNMESFKNCNLMVWSKLFWNIWLKWDIFYRWILINFVYEAKNWVIWVNEMTATIKNMNRSSVDSSHIKSSIFCLRRKLIAIDFHRFVTFKLRYWNINSIVDYFRDSFRGLRQTNTKWPVLS